jgi:poly(3-hydroxybutyrate) depolymerase
MPSGTRWLCGLGAMALLVGLAGQHAAGAAAPQRPGGGHEYREISTSEGALRYALALPDDFDPSRTYPALLAFPPGPQTEPMVDAGFDRYWGPQASRRGWIVVSPAAPGGQVFHRGGDALIPALLDQITTEFQIEGDRFHVAGWSNGGRTAFHVALTHPTRVQSLVVLPGGPPTDADVDRLANLDGIPVRMFAGGRDTEWVRLMQDTEQRLDALGISVETTVLAGEGHVPPSLDGEPIMRLLEELRARGTR